MHDRTSVQGQFNTSPDGAAYVDQLDIVVKMMMLISDETREALGGTHV
jgi:hypothetical protein